MLHTFRYTHPFELESGGALPGFELAYTTAGRLNAARDNAVWICHALTGNAQPQEWWAGLVGPGKLLDPARHFIVCANALGGCYGSTGPLSVHPKTHTPWYHSFPELTNRDMVRAFQLLQKHLDIPRIGLLMGGSLGGQHALEWAVEQPRSVARLVVLASNAWHSPWGIAFNESQRMAIEADVTWQLNSKKAGLQGLKVARTLGVLSYRTYEIYQQRQAEQDPDQLGRYRASAYQQYQGHKLAERFNAYTYYRFSQAMDSHHVGRGRGGAQQALAGVTAKTLAVGIDSDLLFPLQEQEYLVQHIPQARLEVISSLYGHDGFLVEAAPIAAAIQGYFPDFTGVAQAQTEVKV
ncbi:homoserine O-acetyltransferase family protein [Cesiribacter andamanensis]|uniref:Homoserine O-acetyltransferase n=1 Tax=Cesiribacter andamanensis AMV16 TaxID=1279009 RepID=M7NAP1_9BACT|nr:homoserine O-acetyltransferase [Cesiribacter andamanensis]EMR04317.1 Homoserine O-acetyltransferase [Cesiribacter andamanensis AMV16]